jgi:hypothetical protein
MSTRQSAIDEMVAAGDACHAYRNTNRICPLRRLANYPGYKEGDYDNMVRLFLGYPEADSISLEEIHRFTASLRRALADTVASGAVYSGEPVMYYNREKGCLSIPASLFLGN